MGKFVYAIMTAFMIELALYLFAGFDVNKTNIFAILFNPAVLEFSVWFVAIIAALGFIAAVVIVPGLLVQFNIYAFYAGVITASISFALSISHLYSWLYGEFSTLMTSDSLAQVICIMIVSPFLLYYIIACMEWVRANQ